MNPEKTIENHIKNQLTTLGAYFYKNFGGPHSHKGIPDIVGTYATKNHPGRFFAIEVKRIHGGHPTPVQIQNLAQISSNGGLAVISADSHVAKLIHELITHRPTTIPYQNYHLDHYQIITVAQAHQIWQTRLTIPHCQTVLIQSPPHQNHYRGVK